MTKYLDEYQPNSRSRNRGVQSDAQKLKFNNIQSCMALVLVPAGGAKLVGVHLTTSTAVRPTEIQTVMQELRTAVGGGSCDAYVVATFGNYAQTSLLTELKKVARTVSLCDVPGIGKDAKAADVDVKVELNGGRLVASFRRHAEPVKNAQGGFVPNPTFDYRTSEPGKPATLLATDNKPWTPIPFRQI